MFLHFFTYFSSHKLPIVKNIRVICKGLRHFLNLFKRNNVKLSNISILFVCYVKGDNNIYFWNLFTPCLCLWMNLLCLDVVIWYEVKVKVFFVTDSNSLSITYIEFKSSFLYFLWIFLEMAIAHYWFTSCVNRLKFKVYLQLYHNYRHKHYREQLSWPKYDEIQACNYFLLTLKEAI